MNCEKCQELLSDYLDGSLGFAARRTTAAHLEACASCARVRDELRSIISVAHATRDELAAPFNERALWLRIRERVEREEIFNAAPASALRPPASFWSRLLTRRWEFSLPQLASGVAAIVAVVAVMTTMGVQYLRSPARSGDAAGDGPRRHVVRRNYPQDYLQPHEASLRYWQQRVEQRKAGWNPRMRQSFDRSVSVLDEAVMESLDELQRNPHDEVAEQMLNAALRDKIELMREFGEQ